MKVAGVSNVRHAFSKERGNNGFLNVKKGEALFQTHENLEHLAMMERVLGPLPQHMLKRVDRHAEKYVRRGRLDWPEGATSRESIKAVMKLPRLQNLVLQHVDHSRGDSCIVF